MTTMMTTSPKDHADDDDSGSATGRELNAIESENAKNLQSDGFRLYQLQKSRANDKHPYHKVI
jgi:secreted Zn-dependent insulinase-like peptidase